MFARSTGDKPAKTGGWVRLDNLAIAAKIHLFDLPVLRELFEWRYLPPLEACAFAIIGVDFALRNMLEFQLFDGEG